MSLTKEELQKLFPAYFETTNNSIVVDECPEGFEKDEVSGECVEIQVETFDGPQPFKMPESGGEPLTVSADVDVVKDELKKIEPFQPDIDFIKTITEGNTKLIDFQNTYDDGSLDPTTLDKVDEFYELKFGPLVGDVNIPNPFAKEVLSDQNLKDQEKIALEKGNQAFNYLMRNNETINSKLIPEITTSLEDVLLKEKQRLQKKYGKEDAAKAVEEFEIFYNNQINDALIDNPRFQQIFQANRQLASDVVKKDAKRIGVEVLGADAENDGFEKFQRQFKSSKLGLRTMGAAKATRDFTKSLEIANEQAEKEGWEDDKIVYMSTQLGGKIYSKKVTGSGEVKETTWGEAQKMLNEKINQADKTIGSNLTDINKISESLQYFPKNEIFDADGLTWSDLKGIGAQQIPQMALSLVGGGLGIFLQESGGSYTDNLYAAARKEFNLSKEQEPTKEQLMSLIKAGKDNSELALITGAFNSQLERFGSKSLLKAGKAAAAAVPWASMVQGEVLKVLGGFTSKAVLKNNLLSGLFEAGTEILQTVSSQTSQTAAGFDTETMSGINYFNAGEILESGGQGGLMGLLLPFGGGVARQTLIEFKNTAGIIAGKFNPEAMQNYYAQAKSAIEQDSGLSPAKKRERLIALGEIRAQQIKIPSNYSAESKTELIQLMIKRDAITKRYKNKDNSLTPPPIKRELERIKQEIGNIVIASETLKDINTTKELGEKYGLEVDETLSIEQLEDLVLENNIKNWDPNVDPALIIGGKIYLNPKVKAFGAKTASHELLHGIVRKAVTSGQLSLELMQNFAKNNLDNDAQNLLNDILQKSGYTKMMVTKTWGDNVGTKVPYLEENPDEYLALIYEADLLKDPSILTKTIDFLVDLVFKITGKKITLKTEGEVRKFLQGFKKTVESGKETFRVDQIAKQNEGEFGNNIAFSKEDKTVFQTIDKIVPLGTTKDKYSKVNINEAFNATMPGGVISNYISSKSTSPQQFNENIEAIRDRLANFNPDAVRKNNENTNPIQFSEFIVSNTNFSKLVANKKLAIEADKKAQEDRIDGGTLQIANPTSNSSSKPDVDKRSIYPDVVLPKSNEFSNNFLTDTKFNLKTLSTEELSNLTYKTSKIIAPQAFADIWGLPLKVITQSSFNLSDVKNIRRVQSWIRDNALNLIRLLPEGNTDVKVSDSKQKNKDGTFKKIKRGGESLALPDNIRDNPVFYNQLFKPDGTPIKIDSETLNAKGKSKSKSNQYKKRPDITRTQFLKAFGVTDNKSDKQFDVRESEAQSIKGLLEIVGRNITNYYAEQELDTREDISSSKKAISKVKMRSGASKIAFSKAFNIEFTKQINELNGNVNPFYDFSGAYDYKKYKYGSVAADNYAADFLNYGTEFFPIEFLKATAFASGLEKYRLANKMPFFSDSKNKNSRGNFWQFKKDYQIKIDERKKLGLPVAEYTEIEIKKIKFAMQNKDLYFDTSKPEWKLKKNENYEGALLIIKMFEALNKKYPQAINMTTAWFQSAVSSTSHPWRQFSFPRLLDKNYLKFQRAKIKAKKDFDNGIITKEKYDELLVAYSTIKEHMWQQNDASDFLLPNIIDQNVDTTWPFISLNYYQGGIVTKNDNKLKDTKGIYGKPYNHGIVMVKPFKDSLEEAIKSGNINDAIESIIRYLMPEVSNNDGGFNLNTVTFDNKSLAEIYNLQILPTQINKQSIVKQQLLARLIVEKTITKERGRELLKKGILLAPTKVKTSVVNNNKLPAKVSFSKGITFTNQNVLDKMAQLDSEANNARISFSKGLDLNKDFNDIIERATGIGTEKKYGRSKASIVGQDKGKWDWAGIPPSAQDFVGLTRYFAGKGKKGDETIAWIKENFLDPFARANIDISNSRVALANDFKALKKLLKVSPKELNVKITGEPYTVGNAVRVYTWVKQGMKVPGLSKADEKTLIEFVEQDPNLVIFSEQLIAINKDNGYPKPGEGWMAGTITTDLLTGLNTVVRAKYLKQWQQNVNEVFTEENMNKLEAVYGKGYRDALENMLGRMKTGSNRGFKGDTLTGRFVDWLNGSIGAIMFFNMRSAVLQTISAVNFVNWSDNNPLNAAAAFANQPQYWRDVVMLMNSDYLIERRNGLKINVNEADIAEIAAESKNKAKAFISKLLKLGFLPTQIADSFAIASGGATFYRNRLKSLLKEGMSQSEAEAQAFLDFREIAEESQQSSRPDRISSQQAGPMGRVILAFANTPAQYARLMQKAASDLKNRRGDDKTNLSKILYYGFIQNVIFNALQQALFAMAFDDEEASDENKDKKYTGIVNGMADSLLRGIGFHGAAISTLKNVIIKLSQGAEAQDAAIEALDISPPISSKIGKLRSAGRTWDWNKKEIMKKGWSFDNPAWLAGGQVVSAATNIPLDRGIRKLQNLKDASDAENEEWMRVANALGWQKWELEWEKDKIKKKKKKVKKYKKL